MPRAYSQDLRDRVLAAYDRGIRTSVIAGLLGVSRAWARRVKQRRRECGQTSPRSRGGVTVIKVDRTRLADLVREDPDATLAELRDRLGVQCAISTICVALKGLGFSLKKKSCGPRSRIGRTWRSGGATGRTGRARSMPAG